MLMKDKSKTKLQEFFERGRNKELAAFLKERHLEVVDKRMQGGCLWVLGGMELHDKLKEYGKVGLEFRFSPKWK